jgi:hypothetical protein
MFGTKFKEKNETQDLYLLQLFLQEEEIFLSSKASRPTMGQNQPPAQ